MPTIGRVVAFTAALSTASVTALAQAPARVDDATLLLLLQPQHVHEHRVAPAVAEAEVRKDRLRLSVAMHAADELLVRAR